MVCYYAHLRMPGTSSCQIWDTQTEYNIIWGVRRQAFYEVRLAADRRRQERRRMGGRIGTEGNFALRLSSSGPDSALHSPCTMRDTTAPCTERGIARQHLEGDCVIVFASTDLLGHTAVGAICSDDEIHLQLCGLAYLYTWTT
jgi:hypothetical protein